MAKGIAHGPRLGGRFLTATPLPTVHRYPVQTEELRCSCGKRQQARVAKSLSNSLGKDWSLGARWMPESCWLEPRADHGPGWSRHEEGLDFFLTCRVSEKSQAEVPVTIPHGNILECMVSFPVCF